MGKYNLRTMLFVTTVIAVMLATYRFLPKFTRLEMFFSYAALSGCWLFATVGAFIPVAIRQQLLSDRFWYVLTLASMVGTWSGYVLLYLWCENEAKRSPQFPGLGAVLFLGAAALLSGSISFVLGWLVPSHPCYRNNDRT